MIQRIQSVFYLLAALCAAGLFFLPIASSDKTTGMFFEDKIFNVQDHIGLLVLAGLAALLPFVAIFLFKNRSLQLKLGKSSLLFPMLLLAAGIYVFLNSASMSADSQISVVSAKAGMFLPIGVLLFAILGNRFVKKDDDLVKSSDRLR